MTNLDLQDLARELPRLQELARAQWGEVHKRWVPARTKTNPTTGTTYTQAGHYQRVMTKSKLPAWQFNLQQMVIGGDPIQYLREHLGSDATNPGK